MAETKEKHMKNTKILASAIIGLALAVFLLAYDAGFYTLGEATSQYAVLILLLARMMIASVILYLFTITGVFKRLVSGEAKLMDLVCAAVLTLGISLYGNYGGVEVNGVLVNFRDVGAILAGLIGGPIVGTIVGLISGYLRFLQGGVVAAPCMIGTIMAGLLSGIAIRFWKGKLTVVRAIIISLIVELLHVIVIFPLYVLSMGTMTTDQVLSTIVFCVPVMCVVTPLGVAIFAFFVRKYACVGRTGLEKLSWSKLTRK
ncbi:hypothetical protein SDC9_31486 [bioreactor metagenome]|uniref:Signal transduction histidine kinase 5TM receptor LytS transmembrane region domain-containing protein n=1 Tax=bioreactor metagenome TaxID=1076179 RepID=A0A644V2T5_9ZZZZ|nr:LytS/YhcK type 5TM receptor domain-containing protein [Methanocorpusculum sp.]